MLVRDCMTRHPILAEPDTSIVEAQRIMGEHHIRHLPIVGDGKRLVGLVWDITQYLSRMKLSQAMVPARDVITINPDISIEEAARTMIDRQIGCLPVIEGGVIVGIITEMDIMNQLMEMMATRLEGVRVTVHMPNVKGELAKLVAAIAAQGWGILALGGVTPLKEPDIWEAVIKIRDVPRDEISAVIEKVPGHRIVDVREA